MGLIALAAVVAVYGLTSVVIRAPRNRADEPLGATAVQSPVRGDEKTGPSQPICGGQVDRPGRAVSAGW